jgi:hypothetical protein
MVDSVQPWNGQQILAQNAQYSQAQAQAKLGLQEINDQSRMEQQLKQLPQDMGAMQQLEAIQTLALKNGRLDAAEKAATMIGQLSARTEATVLKTEQAAKVRADTQQKERNDILDLMSSSTDERSWNLNRTLALSAHPETSKGMFSLLSQPYSEETVKGLASARMTPAQREKAKQEAALAEEQKAKAELARKMVESYDPMEKLKMAREAAAAAKDYAAISLDKAREDRQRALTAREAANGGAKVGKLDAPTTIEVKEAQTQIKRLGLNLAASDSAAAASDIASHARALQLNSPGRKLSWEEAMQQSLAEFKGTFVTQKNRFSSDKTVYVPRPAGMASTFQATADKPTEADIAAGVPEDATIWIDPTTKQRKWSTK